MGNLVKSHIQITAGILKSFLEKKGKIPKGHVYYFTPSCDQINNESYKKLGTKFGYYSEKNELLLNNSYEKPFGKVAEKLRRQCNEVANSTRNGIELTPEDYDAISNFVTVNFARSPRMSLAIQAHRNDNMIITPDRVIELANSKYKAGGFLDDFILYIIVNTSQTPFIIPSDCIFSNRCMKGKTECCTMFFPFSPKFALEFVQRRQYDFPGSIVLISSDEQIQTINYHALVHAIVNKSDFLVSSERDELERLKKLKHTEEFSQEIAEYQISKRRFDI